MVIIYLFGFSIESHRIGLMISVICHWQPLANVGPIPFHCFATWFASRIFRLLFIYLLSGSVMWRLSLFPTCRTTTQCAPIFRCRRRRRSDFCEFIEIGFKWRPVSSIFIQFSIIFFFFVAVRD